MKQRMDLQSRFSQRMDKWFRTTRESKPFSYIKEINFQK